MASDSEKKSMWDTIIDYVIRTLAEQVGLGIFVNFIWWVIFTSVSVLCCREHQRRRRREILILDSDMKNAIFRDLIIRMDTNQSCTEGHFDYEVGHSTPDKTGLNAKISPCDDTDPWGSDLNLTPKEPDIAVKDVSSESSRPHEVEPTANRKQ